MTESGYLSWILIGAKPYHKEKFDETEINELVAEAFLPEKKFKLFLMGTLIDIESPIQEIEDGYFMLKYSMRLNNGDYGIVSLHESGELLFIASEMSKEQLEQVEKTL